MAHWQEGKQRAIFSLPPSDWAVSCEEEDAPLPHPTTPTSPLPAPSTTTTSELPAGSELFYALVVTGRFIRLEICTNQLSFSGSCQCVKLSGPAAVRGEMPWGDGLERGAKTAQKRKMSSNPTQEAPTIPPARLPPQRRH